MISERLLTAFLRSQLKKSLVLSPADVTMLPAPRSNHSYLLYVHVPFCEQLCPYCSFNRFPLHEGLARAYFNRLREEMRMAAHLGYRFSSMYVGGGTPTVLVDELCSVIDLARKLFSVQEVSCETNPNHLTPEVVGNLEGRVQRLSVGIQSFDDELLRQMQRFERYGSGNEILKRLEAVANFFPTLNADMIFNFPSQTKEILREDVRKIIDSAVNQATFYALMTAPSVARSMRKTVGKVDYTREGAYYSVLRSEIERAFRPASAWCFARKGGDLIDEYIVDYEEYVGLGSGAFSHLDGTLYVNTFSLREYDRLITLGRMSVSQKRKFSLREQMRYRFMMELFGLRLDKARFQQSFGQPVERALWLETKFMRLAGAFDQNDKNFITLTPKGQYLLVVMMREFFANINDVRDQARSLLPPEERLISANH